MLHSERGNIFLFKLNHLDNNYNNNSENRELICNFLNFMKQKCQTTYGSGFHMLGFTVFPCLRLWFIKYFCTVRKAKQAICHVQV